MENNSIPGVLRHIGTTDIMMKRLQSRTDKTADAMYFLVTLDSLTERYKYYAEQIAKKLNYNKEDVEPYVYLVITSVANYMLFTVDSLVVPQMQIAK